MKRVNIRKVFGMAFGTTKSPCLSFLLQGHRLRGMGHRWTNKLIVVSSWGADRTNVPRKI